MQTTSRKVTVVHYADPWCWKCWGLEPVVQRLKEVYGEEIEVIYKMGGLYDDFGTFLSGEGLESLGQLQTWIKQSDKEMRNPFKLSYMTDAKPPSTFPASLAIKAAEEQGRDFGYKYYRAMIEAIQLDGENGSERQVQLRLAQKAGLDPVRFEHDLEDPAVRRKFLHDRISKQREEMSFSALKIISASGKAIKVTGYGSSAYEQAIDKVSEKKVWKRTPIDLLEYFERRRNQRISAREVSTVFSIETDEAVRRLEGLSREGLLQKSTIKGVGDFWSANRSSSDSALTLDQVELAHVIPSHKPLRTAELEDILKPAVKKLYTEVSLSPDKEFHFPVGMKGAILAGYPRNELNKLPKTAVESFAGVGYPFASKVIREEDTVLDVGSGSGTDVLVSALKTGGRGKVFGMDFTDAMIKKAKSNIRKAKAKNARIIRGEATKIPLPDGVVDVVTSNGVLNLVPNKRRALEEISRVLRPRGHLQISDILVRKDVSSVCGVVPQLWADCIGGAAVQSEFEDMMRTAGFNHPEAVRSFDYFAASPSQQMRRLARTFGAKSVTIKATKW